MLIVLVLLTVSGALLVEWMLHHVSENYELEWEHPAFSDVVTNIRQILASRVRRLWN